MDLNNLFDDEHELGKYADDVTPEEEAMLDSVVEDLKERFKTPETLIPNPQKIADIKKAMSLLYEACAEDSVDLEIKYEKADVLTKAAAIRIRALYLSVDDIAKYVKAISLSDNLSVANGTEEKCNICLSFSNVLVKVN